MKKVIVIPARLDSSRLPKKVLLDLNGKTVLQRVYEQCLKVKNVDEVYVATDSLEIKEVCETFTNQVVITKSTHQSGTDRIGEAISSIDCDIVINVQGDEPFIDSNSLKKLIQIFRYDPQKEIALASLMTPLNDIEDIENPNVVKVIVDLNDFALYFSRSPIPFNRENVKTSNHFKHIGVYAFRKQALIEFSKQEITPLESVEKIECIRYLEHGKKIKMVVTQNLNFEIDTPRDLERAEAHLSQLESQ